MGWGRTLLLGDIGNRMDIADTEEEIRRLKRELDKSDRKNLTQDERLAQLTDDVAELRLYVAACMRLLTANGGLSREELEAMINTIDAEDGRRDGKFDGDIL